MELRVQGQKLVGWKVRYEDGKEVVYHTLTEIPNRQPGVTLVYVEAIYK